MRHFDPPPGRVFSPNAMAFPPRRDVWMNRNRPPSVQYQYSHRGMYGVGEYLGHEVQEPKMPYPGMEYEGSVYSYSPMAAMPFQRRSVSGPVRNDARYMTGPSGHSVHVGRMARMETPAAAKMGGNPGPLGAGKTRHGMPSSTSIWYERSAACYEKSKEIFDYISKRCESQECTHADQEKLVHITKERTVRQLDFNAASQAMKANEMAEKRWSTEPLGAGFRTFAKDLRGLIDNNSIDATRLMYPMLDDADPCEAENIAAVVEELDKRAGFMKQYAESTAQVYGIPLHSQSDNFLEYAEHAYLSEDTDGMYSGPLGGEDAQGLKQKDAFHPPNAVLRHGDASKIQLPQTSLAQFASKGDVPQNLAGVDGKPATNASAEALKSKSNPQINNMLVKEGPVNSMGTFDIRSNHWWTPTGDGFSPKLESMGMGITPWGINDDIFGGTDQYGLEEHSSGVKDAKKSLATAEKTCSSKEESRPSEADALKADGQGTEEGHFDDEKGLEGPMCYCGVNCEKRETQEGLAFWGCKKSKCGAQMPILRESSWKIERTISKPRTMSTGRETKLPKRFVDHITTSKTSSKDGKEKFVDLEQDVEKLAGVDVALSSLQQKITSSQPSKNPMSIESSGVKGSGTLIKVNSDSAALHQCKKNASCDRTPGHSGKCTKGRGSPNASGKKSHGSHKRRAEKDADQILSMDKSALCPHEELILSNGQAHEPGKKETGPSKSSQATESEKKVIEKMERNNQARASNLVKSSEVTSRRAYESENAGAMSPEVSNEAEGLFFRIKSGPKITAEQLERMIEEERNLIPPEDRCYRKLTCLNPAGHRGRCRIKPNAIAAMKPISTPKMLKRKKKTSKKKGLVDDYDTVESDLPEGADVGTGTEGNETKSPADMRRMMNEITSETSPSQPKKEQAKVTGRKRGRPKGSKTRTPKVAISNGKSAGKSKNVTVEDEEEVAEKAESMTCAENENLDTETRKKQSLELLSTSTSYIDGLALLKFEFETESSAHIRKFYGSSQIFPASEWRTQKDEYLTQRNLLKINPPLHSTAMNKAIKKSRLAVQRDSKKSSEEFWKDLLSPERSLYREEKSSIHGFGLFATLAIKSGLPVAELLGEFISQGDAKVREAEYAGATIALKNIIGLSRGSLAHPKHMMFSIDKDWALDATKAGSSARFANHSCSPNCQVKIVTDPAGAVHLVLHAISDIHEGDELTFDYEDLHAGGFTCECKSATCRKEALKDCRYP